MRTKKSAAKPALKSTELESPKPSPVMAAAKLPVKETKAPVAVAPAPAPAVKPPAAPAPAPVPAKVLTASAAPVHTNGNGTVTTIEVKMDVGYGNAIFVRGQGAGLNWDRGLPLKCVDAKTWRWSGETKDAITFKLLMNDQIWSVGSDLKIAPGQKLEVVPKFS